MNAYKIAVKLFVEQDTFGPTEFVPIFHRWIQDQSIEGHALIDVADYAHVPAGPGTLVVAFEANIYMDRVDNRVGLLYARKTKMEGAFADRLRAVLSESLKIAAKLEAEPEFAGRLKFRTDEIAVRLHDRLEAPNTPETFAAVKSDFESVVGDFGGTVVQGHLEDTRKLFEVVLKNTQSPSVEELLSRIAKPLAV